MLCFMAEYIHPEQSDRSAQYYCCQQKRFFIDYCANERGKFLRITEVAHGRRNTIIIPETGLSEFGDLVNDILDIHEGVAEDSANEVSADTEES